MFGLDHCVYFKCSMNGANSLGEELKTPLYIFPVCLNILNYLIDYIIKERYIKLSNFFIKHDLKQELEWKILGLTKKEQ